jgi:hypothetical protein
MKPSSGVGQLGSTRFQRSLNSSESKNAIALVTAASSSCRYQE